MVITTKRKMLLDRGTARMHLIFLCSCCKSIKFLYDKGRHPLLWMSNNLFLHYFTAKNLVFCPFGDILYFAQDGD
jgi:hypothetical protein